MRAVRGKNKILSLIGIQESKLYDLIELQGFLPVTGMSERDIQIAEHLYQQNILNKVRKNNQPGYMSYESQQKNSF